MKDLTEMNFVIDSQQNWHSTNSEKQQALVNEFVGVNYFVSVAILERGLKPQDIYGVGDVQCSEFHRENLKLRIMKYSNTQ